MKKSLIRSVMIWFIAYAFFIGLGYFTVRLIIHSSEWAQMPMNAHISVTGLAQAGIIYDRNGNVLAQSIDGDRVYSDDYSTRLAMLHSVGDDSTNISTAVQSMYRTGLTGYNFILGLGLPESFKSSSDITLTLDSNACAAAYNAMVSRGYNGACVVYNYKTGEIICKVSTPAYDPYAPPEIIEGDDTYEGVYLDNVISSTYPPGSTFKIITTAAALDNINNAEERYLYCEGSKIIGGQVVTCVEPHGEINLKQAMAESCNIYFAELAVELGADKMTEYAEMFGCNKTFTVDDNTLAVSKYDVSEADTTALAWSGVGQYTDMVNPMHMAMICSAIANGGTPTEPYMIESVTSFLNYKDLVSNSTKGKRGERMMSSTTADKLSEIMRYTVSDHYGDSMFEGLAVAAKTGTAETGTGAEDGWIVGFVTEEDCPLAFAVCVEHGGFGYSSAGPVANAALQASAIAVRGY
ncbi:MAG: penicillin-binding protein [Lachnospiraceae bacterium]|nr:penicillin-binding protein [Lachnospiraceae bacterium]